MPIKVALAGNPNCGKTTLFNTLTGSSAHVGNWPGVTVERREGRYRRQDMQVDIIDLPGVYSLSPYSPEEAVAGRYILDEAPDVIINIVDVTSLERSLYLTTELLEMDTPVVIAFNMMDTAEKNGYRVLPEMLEAELGVPVVPISAAKKKGIDALMGKALSAAKSTRKGKSVLLSSKYAEHILHISHLLERGKIKNPQYRAVKMLEGDKTAAKNLKLDSSSVSQIKAIVMNACSLAKKVGIDADIADLRYKYITGRCGGAVIRPEPAFALTPSDKADFILTHRIFGIPIFMLIMAAVFILTFSDSFLGVPMPGALLQGVTERGVEMVSDGLRSLMVSLGAADWSISLLVDGVAGGVGAVLSFMPQILLLFLFITILEGSGYMARAAFIMDQALRKVGLSGKSFVPMLMGFGCSVPAIMACRTIENDRDRRLTMMLIPFMSCGAKLPIYALLTLAFFDRYQGVIIFFIYFTGIAVAVLSAMILKKTVLKGEAVPFIMELPAYRMPAPGNVIMSLWEKLKHFLLKAGTIILGAAVVVWFLQNFSFSLKMVEDTSQSMIGYIGSALSVIFRPLGFGDSWQLSVAILAGFIAKEAVVSSIGVLYGMGDAAADNALVGPVAGVLASGLVSPAAGLSFMIFNLLAPPCCAAIATLRQEMGSEKWFWLAILFYIITAYAASFVVYQTAAFVFNIIGI